MVDETGRSRIDAREPKSKPRPDCPLCGGSSYVLYEHLRDRYFEAPGWWTVRRCRTAECGLVWIDPLVGAEDIGALYTRYYTHVEAGRSPDWLRRMYRLLVGIYVGSRTGRAHIALAPIAWLMCAVHPAGKAEFHHAVLHLPPVIPGQRLLDVGTGSAKHFSRLASLGLEVEGIESDSGAVEAARQRGISVTVGDFMTHRYQSSHFDFVTMSHLIEHVREPLEAFRKALDLLVPGGRLVVLTPNVGSLGHRRFGRNWSMLDVPRHLTLFDKQTIGNLADRAGFEIEELASTVCYAREVIVVSSRLAAEPDRKPSLTLGAMDSFRGIPYQLGERFRPNGDGEELLLVARKPG